MNGKITVFFGIFLLLFFCGCNTTPFVGGGLGYARFNTDDIKAVTNLNGQAVETKIDHVDSFSAKLRVGVPLAESVSQLRTGVEVRAGLGGGRDVESVGNQTADSRLILLLFGGGPFISWKQPLGDAMYLEAGSFINAYTVGIHETVRKVNNVVVDVDDEGGFGWSGGIYGKIGLLESPDIPLDFALEASYEYGQWDFGKDNDNIDVHGLTILLTSEVNF